VSSCGLVQRRSTQGPEVDALSSASLAFSVAFEVSSVAEVFAAGDERSELIEGGVVVPVPRWPYSFFVSSMKSSISWGNMSGFTSGSCSLACLDLFL